ncbi:MAG TPA: glycosyltransferase, partial [Polyangiaceae bacterium]
AVYGVPDRKIDLILHGIPDVPFVDSNLYKDQFQLQGKQVLLTFGLLSPNKGIEHVIEALPEIVAEFPDVAYVVLGATHPNLLREQGEAYRESLQRLAESLGVAENVRFFNQFVSIDELKQFLLSADIYVTPYLNPAQITSGTLSYAFGCGKPVVSTPYWHAEELLADGRGVLVPFADPKAISGEIRALLADDARREAMRERAYLAGREMIWSRVAEQYLKTFERARRSRVERPLKAVPRANDTTITHLPELRLDHLQRLTDSVGLFQHAHFTLPNYAEGYCLDDNARALLFTVTCDLASRANELARLETIYASFIDHAFNDDSGRFRNFMSFERRWLEERGSDDSHGRALWALGTCSQRSSRPELRGWSSALFLRALGASETDSPRAWAFSLLGIDCYLTRLPGDRRAARLRAALAARLLDLYQRVREPGWLWLESVLAYENARLPQALIVSGHAIGNRAMLDAGLESLRWLVAQQTAERGHFRPIGCNGFFSRGGPRALFDQQPVEAQATVAACVSAFRVTRELFWYAEARRAFEWFMGRNDLGVPVFDVNSGGCHDGLHVDRVNLNQGAESTLAFLLSLVEMKRLERQLATRIDDAQDGLVRASAGSGLADTRSSR